MQSLDYIAIATYVGVLVTIVLWTMRQTNETTADFFLNGRHTTWFVIGFSIFATNIGTEHLIGLAGTGASSGIAMAHWEMQGWLLLVLGWLFVPFYSRIMPLTVPEYLERRFSPSCRRILSATLLLSYVVTKVSVIVFASGLVFRQMFGIDELWGVDFFWVSSLGFVMMTALYTIYRGMKSVLFTSVVQTPVMILGSVAVLVLALQAVGGWDEMMEVCGATPINGYGDKMTTLMRDSRDIDYPWLGAMFGSAIIGLWYWCGDQLVVQRVLSARDEREARRGSIFAAYLKLLPVFIYLIPGMIAFALDSKGVVVNGSVFRLPSADAAFPTLVARLLPAGIKGLVLCGVLSALMSSLSSIFNSSAMLFTVDFYKKSHPRASEKELVSVGRYATFAIVVLGLLWIPIMRSIGDVLYNYIQDVQSCLAPGISAILLLGIFFKRITPEGGRWGMITGLVFGLNRLIAKVYYGYMPEASESFYRDVFYDYNWLYFCIWLFVLCIVVTVVVSFFTKRQKDEELQGLVLSTVTPAQKAASRASWNKADVIHSLIILAVIAAVYAYFW